MNHLHAGEFRSLFNFLLSWVHLHLHHAMHFSSYQFADDENAAFRVEAPSMQAHLNVQVGQTAQAARTQPSHRPLLTLMVLPAWVAFNSKGAVPDEPVVDVGAPPHFVIAPAALHCQHVCFGRRDEKKWGYGLGDSLFMVTLEEIFQE
jgi:hypothetical protein